MHQMLYLYVTNGSFLQQKHISEEIKNDLFENGSRFRAWIYKIVEFQEKDKTDLVEIFTEGLEHYFTEYVTWRTQSYIYFMNN